MRLLSAIKYFLTIATLLLAAQVFAATTTTKTPPPPSDANITAIIKTKIAQDSTVSATEVNVTCKQGKVALNGKVDTAEQASKIVELAQSSDGVKDVDTTQLTVTNSTPTLADTLITAKINGAYIQQKLYNPNDPTSMKIDIETKDGVVYLTGTVVNSEQMKNAARIAKKTGGVKTVLNNLRIAN